MKTILNKYRKNLTFTYDESVVIELATEKKVIETDTIIEDFCIFRDKELQNYIGIDSEKVIDFNEYYDNGLTHIENFIKLIEFIN